MNRVTVTCRKKSGSPVGADMNDFESNDTEAEDPGHQNNTGTPENASPENRPGRTLNFKLIGAGFLVLAAVCSAGVGYWGLDYAKKTSRDVYDNHFNRVKSYISDASIPLKITYLGTESDGFFADTVNYMLNYKDSLQFPVVFRNSYGFGSVDTSVSIDPKFYDALSMEAEQKKQIRTMFDSVKCHYDGVHDRAEAGVEFGDGALTYSNVAVKWKNGSATAGIEVFSAEPTKYRFGSSFDELFFGDGKNDDGFLLRGYRSSAIIAQAGISSELSVDKLMARERVKEILSLSNLVNHIDLVPSASGTNNYYDGAFRITFDDFKFNAADYFYHAKNLDFVFKVKDLNFSSPLSKCQDKKSSVRKLLGCVMSERTLTDDKDFLGTVTNTTTATVDLRFVYKDANVDLKNSVSIKPDADLRKSGYLNLLNHLVVRGIYTIDSRFLLNYEIFPLKYARMIRSYARDPGALVLEYQILFENGKLSINGKEVM